MSTGSSVGRASVGRASVSGPPASPSLPPPPTGGAVSARASVPVSGSAAGAASAPPSTGAKGRASVGTASVPGNGAGGGSAGRASVGRATVGRASVAAPVAPVNPGGPAGPAGPGRPDGPAGAGQGATPRGPRPPRSKKKNRRRNWIVASIAILIMIAGGSLVGGTYVFAKVPAPDALPAGQSTTIYYSDGKTEMAKIGDENRTIVPLDKIPVHLQHAVIAAEDRSFYENEGVDFAGIVRAAWNNATGGERQGASTITQQYARKIAELTEDSYSRKVEEAAVAMKLADKYTKDEILGFYLNTVYFGRAYGVEAAAYAYFGRESAMDLTVEESIMLAGFIKNPGGGGGTSAYDPNVNPNDAKARWELNRDALIEVKPKLAEYGSDSYQVSKDMQMPMPAKYDQKTRQGQAQFGLDTPTGHVVHNVMDELAKLHATNPEIKKLADKPEGLKNAGLKITTTIDLAMQGMAQTFANVKGDGSPLYGYPANLTAALVSIEPYTGRVLAYYGGSNGSGTDFAGSWTDPILSDGKPTVGGYHPPASSFKVYTLAAALSQGISIKSFWDGRPREMGGKPKGAIRNSNPEGDCANGSCELWKMTAQSLNVPFYALTLELENQAASVLETAKAAGIRSMRDDKGKIWDLSAHDSKELANTGKGNTRYFENEIGFGQYAVTVIDHANGLATLAAGGQAAKAHFIREIVRDGTGIFQESKKLTAMPKFDSKMAADEAWTLQKVSASNNWNAGNHKFAAKTGTWENGNDKYKGENAHSWTVGYTGSVRDLKNPSKNYNGVATAVWVGNVEAELPIKLKDGKSKMQGSSGAGKIFGAYMKEITKGKPVGKFPEPRFVGDEDAGDGTPPSASADPNQSKPPGQQPGENGNDTPGNGPGNGGNGGGNQGRPTRPGRP
jgi:membrane peptidoglycan carboxypeptidase